MPPPGKTHFGHQEVDRYRSGFGAIATHSSVIISRYISSAPNCFTYGTVAVYSNPSSHLNRLVNDIHSQPTNQSMRNLFGKRRDPYAATHYCGRFKRPWQLQLAVRFVVRGTPVSEVVPPKQKNSFDPPIVTVPSQHITEQIEEQKR